MLTVLRITKNNKELFLDKKLFKVFPAGITEVKYFNFFALSVPVEEIFTVTGKTFRADRNRLSNDNFQMLMLMMANYDL